MLSLKVSIRWVCHLTWITLSNKSRTLIVASMQALYVCDTCSYNVIIEIHDCGSCI